MGLCGALCWDDEIDNFAGKQQHNKILKNLEEYSHIRCCISPSFLVYPILAQIIFQNHCVIFYYISAHIHLKLTNFGEAEWSLEYLFLLLTSPFQKQL